MVDMDKIGGGGILPVARMGKNRVMFLLGREQVFEGWKGSGKYADFGGKRDKGENPLECAAREGYEEGMGFLGSKSDLRKKVNPSSADYIDAFVDPERLEHFVVFMRVYYNKYLPNLFRDVFEYFVNCSKKMDAGKYVIESCPEGFLEKDEIRWFGYRELKDMVERKDDRLRPYFARCLEMFFKKYSKEEDIFIK